MTETFPILIIGGNGKTGRLVNDALTARDIATRPVSRSTTPAFDWTDRSTWDAALAGIRVAYVTYQPDLAVPSSVEDIAELCRRARKAGIEHIVLLSGRGEISAQRAEAELERSGLAWTIIRAGWFMQNFSEGFLTDAIRAGELALPAGPVPEPFVDIRDIADIAVAALTDPRHRGQLYEVTGPRSLSFEAAVAGIAQAVGRTIVYRQTTFAEFQASLEAEGLPQLYVDFFHELFTEVLDGRNVVPANGVEKALGRAPRGFAEFAAEAAASGVWS